MKSIIYKVLVAMLFCCNQAYAQNVLLPYGQDSKEPWEAKYFYAIIGTNEPDENWFTEDFDDSDWETIQGPISTNTSTRLSYYVTQWKENYSSYWVRRRFTVADIKSNNIFYFTAAHDDGCVAYLNGHLIYNNGNVVNPGATNDVTKEVFEYIHEGENVLAVRVSDTGRGDAYMDFGLTGYYTKPIADPYFNSGSGWTGSFDRHNYDDNNIGYRYGRNWACQQSIFNNPSGLYRLSANACGMEYYDNQTNATNAKDNEIPARLFINSHEKPISSAFSERAETDIYGGSYRWVVDGGYVPYYVDRTPAAFKRDMYKVSLYSYYEPDETNTMTVGIHCYPANDIKRWAAWDNMELTVVKEEELDALLDSIVSVVKDLPEQHFEKNIKDAFSGYLKDAYDAVSYAEKGLAFSNIINTEPVIRKSICKYEEMNDYLAQLTDSLAKAMVMTSPATIAEAKAYSQAVLDAYNMGAFDNDDVVDAIATMKKMMQRLSYTYLDIAVTTPGALGDSILAKVENFADVYSIKISGTLNDGDITNIQSRLTNLREIDMTDVEMTALPNRFFYQRKALEIVKLPKQLVTIGEYAFYQCYGLTHIDFPATLTTISRYGFDECDNIQEVILPEGLVSLGEYAFHSCDNNKYVKLPSTLQVISNSCFEYNLSLNRIDFSEGLTHINNRAFFQCFKLDNIVFPNTLYYIGANAFYQNSSLKNIVFNEGLYQIVDNAFYDCDALEEITLPSTLVMAYESPFDYCDNLKKVTCLALEPPYSKDQMPYGVSMEGRELYVPSLSLNNYKQTTPWDLFPTINPIDYLPEHITVLGDLHLTLPESMSEDYKPTLDLIHAQKGSYLQYGQLTVNGEGTLSLSDFSMVWDPNYQYNGYNRYSPCYCSLVNNSHLRSDKVSVNTYTRNDRWTFISFPFDVKVAEIETICDGTTNWVIRKYDGQKRADGETNNTWVKMTLDDVLNAGEGYIIQGSRYIGTSWQDYSGFRIHAINDANKNNIFRTTDIVVSLNEYQSEFAHNRSWNLIGNPYPSFYDTRFMDFNAPFTVWNINNNTYFAYSPVDDSYILCPGEALFVQRPVDVESIVFSKEGRQTDRSVRTLQTPAKAPVSSARTVINLTLTDGVYTDHTRVVINDLAEMGYEPTMDAPKFMSDEAAVPQLFTSYDNVDYAINERPLADGQVCLSTRFGVDGIYTIALPADVYYYNVILEDKLTGRRTKLTADSDYTFSAKAGTTVDRFVLYLDNSITGINAIDCDTPDDDAYYTIDGIKVDTPTRHGIYIQKNKKVIVK